MATDPEVMEKELFELAEKVIDGDSNGAPDHPAAVRLAQMVRARYTHNSQGGKATTVCRDQTPHKIDANCTDTCAGF